MSHHAQIDPGVPSRLVVASASLTLILCSNAMAQTTVFTYQGALTDAGNPATGMYDMQFKLFDSVDIATGNQVGTTIDRIGVPVTNGRFTVELDFGPGMFDGSAGPRESEYHRASRSSGTAASSRRYCSTSRRMSSNRGKTGGP